MTDSLLICASVQLRVSGGVGHSCGKETGKSILIHWHLNEVWLDISQLCLKISGRGRMLELLIHTDVPSIPCSCRQSPHLSTRMAPFGVIFLGMC
jgi:hypothetical protein